MIDRRRFLGAAGSAALASSVSGAATAAMDRQAPVGSDASAHADYTIRIATGLVELGADTTVSTKTYNGQFPGPLMRLQEGKRVVVDIHNDTDAPEQLHWHGQFLPVNVDGAAEEGTPFIAARGHRRIALTPQPSGFRFFHSHVRAGADLSRGLYSGQAGLVYIEPRRNSGAYDQEIFLTLKEFGPWLSRTEMAFDSLSPIDVVPALRAQALAALDASLKRGLPQAYELAYEFYSVNGRSLGQGEPIRVKPGERALLHVLNASASEIRSLALPGHVFKVVALDGNPVPRPAEVPVLWLGPAERISAIVEMKMPGVWVLGDTDDDARAKGAGIVVEYSGRKGAPQWAKPGPFRWDYRRFADPAATAAQPDETLVLTFAVRNAAREGFDEFTINGVPFSMERMQPRFPLVRGRRYRLRLRNATDDTHPIHLHRHSFELTSIAGHPTAGVMKDVVLIGGFQEMTVDFVADQPGLSLFHCHMQHHMDFGFMALFDCS